MANPNDWTGTTIDSSKIIGLMRRIHNLEASGLTPSDISIIDGDGAGNVVYFLGVSGVNCYQLSPFRFLHSNFISPGDGSSGITAVGTKVYYVGAEALFGYDKSGQQRWSPHVWGSDPNEKDNLGNFLSGDSVIDLTIRGGFLYVPTDLSGFTTDLAFRYVISSGDFDGAIGHDPWTFVDDDDDTTGYMEQEGIWIGSGADRNKVYGSWGSTTLPVITPLWIQGIAVGNAILATGRESGNTDNSFWILNKTSGSIEEYYEGDETFPPAYTTWYAYRPTLNNRVSMGTYPASNWISTNAWPYRMIIEPYARDLRAALEILAELYKHPGNGNVYNFINGDSNNLYYIGNGDRTKYGASGGAKYTWTHSAAQMDSLNEVPDIIFGEIDECIGILEMSNPIF